MPSSTTCLPGMLPWRRWAFFTTRSRPAPVPHHADSGPRGPPLPSAQKCHLSWAHVGHSGPIHAFCTPTMCHQNLLPDFTVTHSTFQGASRENQRWITDLQLCTRLGLGGEGAARVNEVIWGFPRFSVIHVIQKDKNMAILHVSVVVFIPILVYISKI